MPAIEFDLDADGLPDLTSWTRRNSDDAFLVWDRNENGEIDDGSELFGSATLLLDGSRARHGFEALTEIDRLQLGGNENGRIDPGDQHFSSLALWLDDNRNGWAEAGELSSLAAMGVASIELTQQFLGEQDHWGNDLVLSVRVAFTNGDQSRAVDIFFARATIGNSHH